MDQNYGNSQEGETMSNWDEQEIFHRGKSMEIRKVPEVLDQWEEGEGMLGEGDDVRICVDQSL